jgi:hypothetical protein
MFKQLQLLEAQYEERLRLQGAHLEDIRELLSFERQERTRLSKVVETMASEQKITQYDLRGVPLAGCRGKSSTTANQYDGTINIMARTLTIVTVDSWLSVTQDCTGVPRGSTGRSTGPSRGLRLLTSNNPEKCQPARMKTRIAGLFGVLLMLGGGVATATDFANNVLELSKKLDLPAETFRPQLEHFKQIYPEF